MLNRFYCCSQLSRETGSNMVQIESLLLPFAVLLLLLLLQKTKSISGGRLRGVSVFRRIVFLFQEVKR